MITKYMYLQQIKEYFDTLSMDKSICTIRSYSIAVDKFFDSLDIKEFTDLEKITSAICREYQAGLLKQGVKKSSVNAYTRPLKTIFNWMVENEYLPENPWMKVKLLKQPKRIIDFLSQEEQDRMLKACKNLQEKLVVAILLTTGMRRNELCILKLADYGNSHILINGKGSKQRILPLLPEVIKLLEEYLVIRNEKHPESEYLLVSKMGTPFAGESIRMLVNRVCIQAGLDPERIKKIHPHLLRHSAASNLVGKTDIRVIQGMLGHSNLATTQIYAHLSNAALDQAMLQQHINLG
jgi:integrase/recombinase XerC